MPTPGDKADLADRLRRWAISPDAGPASDLMDDAADEIDRLRSQPCPYVTGNVTRYCTLTPFTLTDQERAAIQEVIDYLQPDEQRHQNHVAATLRGLLDR